MPSRSLRNHSKKEYTFHMNLSQNFRTVLRERPLGRRRLGGFVYPSVFIFTRVYPRRTCNLMSSWDPKSDRPATLMKCVARREGKSSRTADSLLGANINDDQGML